jgi:photosystem II stability/assembly factor-like uncharacterized protein
MRVIVVFLLCSCALQAQYGVWKQIDNVGLYGYQDVFVLDDSTVCVASRFGLYRGIDGGLFWREVLSDVRPEYIASVVPYPAVSPNGLVMSSDTRIGDKGTAGIFSSTDGGVTWGYHGGAVGNSSSDALPAGMDGFYMKCGPDYLVHLDRFGFARRYIEGIPTAEIRQVRGIATFDDNRALAYTYPGTVYVSGNGWAPWQQDWKLANRGIEDATVLHIHTEGDDAWAGTECSGIKHATRPKFTWSDASGGLGQKGELSMYVRRIFRDKRGPLVALTYNGFYRSTDGRNWDLVSSALPDWGKPARSAIDYQGNYYVLYGRDSVIVSEDEAQSWSLRMTGLVMDSVFDIIVQGGELLSAGKECVFAAPVGSSGDPHWHQRIEGLSNPRLRVFTLLPDSSVLAFGVTGTVSRKPLRDRAWTEVSTDLAGETVHCAAAGPGIVLAGTARGALFLSTDSGATWTERSPDVGGSSVVEVLAISDSVFLAGTFGAGLHRSDDAGLHWSRISNGITHPNITALLRAPDGVVYAGSYGDGVFRSDDGGLTWRVTSAALPGRYVTDMAANHISVVAVSTMDAGVFSTRHGGDAWSQVFSGGENPRIKRLLHYPSGNYFYGIRHDGTLRRSMGGLPTSAGELPVPSVMEIHAVYPNPFRDAITVEFEIRKPGAVRITLLDMLGREVARLEEDIAAPGFGHRTLRPVSIIPGVYLIVFESGGERMTRLVTNFR